MNFTEKNYENTFFQIKNKTGLILIDNGVYELRAGYSNTPSLLIQNKIYKNKERVSLNPFAMASTKTMFDNDVINNFEVLEHELDLVLEYLDPSKLDNLIMTVTPESPTNNQLISFLFETYKFNNIQLIYDFIPAYTRTFGKEDCLIVKFGYSSTFVYYINNNSITDIDKLNFGIRDLKELLQLHMVERYKEYRKDYRGLSQYLRAAIDYEKESFEIFDQMCDGVYKNVIFLTDPPKEETIAEPVVKKVRKNTIINIPKIDYGLLTANEKNLTPDQVKEKRKQRLVYYSTLFRLQDKIKKMFIKMDDNIEFLEEELEKRVDSGKYVKRKKNRFKKLKRRMEMREGLRRTARNKKSHEYTVKNTEYELSDEDLLLRQQIADAEDSDLENELIEEMDSLIADIKEIEPDFIPFYANAYEILRGDNIGRQCVNLELIKFPEVYFYPNIIQLEEKGLVEIFEKLSKKYTIKNVLICGGFSCIKNLKERIYKELEPLTKAETLNIHLDRDSQSTIFPFDQFSDLLPVYNRKDYENMQ